MSETICCYRVDGIVVAEGAVDMGASQGGVALSARNVRVCVSELQLSPFYKQIGRAHV